MYEDVNRQRLDNRVRIENGETKWVGKFEELKTELKEIIGDDVIYVEHVGTTSATDIMAYPVIDIAVSVTNEHKRDNAARMLEDSRKNYHIVKSHCNEKLVRKGSQDHPEAYIHIAVTDGEFFKSMVRFAKELKTNPTARDSYRNVHIYAKDQYYNDMLKYYHAKTQFIKTALGHHSIKYRNERVNVEKTNNISSRKGIPSIVIKACIYIVIIGFVYTMPWMLGKIYFNYIDLIGVSFYNILPGILMIIPAVLFLRSLLTEKTSKIEEIIKFVLTCVGFICGIYLIIHGLLCLL